MIRLKVDPHTHTIFSGHAFSTIEENARKAAEAGLEAIGMTDHFWYGFGGEHKNAPDTGPAMNMQALPREIYGVRILAGTEIDIVDFEGNLAFHDFYRPYRPEESLKDRMLKSREVAIASLHFFDGFKSGSVEQNTRMYCSVVADPDVDILGHPERAGLDLDLEAVLLEAKAGNTLIEINEHSMEMGEGTAEACRRLAQGCARLQVPVVVSSDAHSSFHVGQCPRALEMLQDIGFPEGLVANTSLEKLGAAIGW